MTFPIKYTEIPRIFGKKYLEGWHLGVDYLAPFDTPVYAISVGVVKYSIDLKGFGSLAPATKGGLVIVEHTNKDNQKYLALYCHLRRFVITGETVKEGTILGKIINFKNGNLVVPHLHFGIHESVGIILQHLGYAITEDLGFYRDPQKYLIEKV